MNNKRRSFKRGTILVVALGLLAALAIIGATMINVARIDRYASQSFSQSAEMDLAVTAVLEYHKGKLAQDYWRQRETLGDAQPYDNPTGLGISLSRPNEFGKMVLRDESIPWSPGLTPTDNVGETTGWANIPMQNPIPLPATTVKPFSTKPDGNLPEGKPLPFNVGKTKLFISGNRYIEVSTTLVDLGGRLNVNVHGARTPPNAPYAEPTGGGGQRYLDVGSLWTDVTPDWGDEGDGTAKTYRAVALGEGWKTVSLKPASGNATISRYGTKVAPDGEPDYLALDLMNPHNLGKGSCPFTNEDQLELLNVWGTSYNSRLERTLPSTLRCDATAAGMQKSQMYRKTLFTTTSMVSEARKRYNGKGDAAKTDREVLGGLYVKADLNNSTRDELKKALLASGIAFAKSGTGVPLFKDLDQIWLNMIAYRSENPTDPSLPAGKGRPEVLSVDSTTDGKYTVCSVTRQPFLNEVYISDKVVDAANKKTIYTMWIELANPYDRPLVKNPAGGSYTKLTVGEAAGSVTTIDSLLVSSIPAGGKTSITGAAPASWTDGVVVKVVIDVPDGRDYKKYLSPVILYNDDTTKTREIMIDRIKLEGKAGVSEDYFATVLPTTKSYQRPGFKGPNMDGTAGHFFGGWVARQIVAEQTCYNSAAKVGSFAQNEANNDVSLLKKSPRTPRIIESRATAGSVEPVIHTLKGAKDMASDLPFRRVGDISHILRWGHVVDTTVPANSRPITEVLLPKSMGGVDIWDDSDSSCYVDLTNSSSSRGNYQQFLQVLSVYNQYYNGMDDDGDVKFADVKKTWTKAGIIGVDDKDPGYWTSSTDTPADFRDNLGPEIYRWGAINVNTAPPAVIRAMLPYRLHKKYVASGSGAFSMWDVAANICSAVVKSGGTAYKSPADILNATVSTADNTIKGKTVFLEADAVDNKRTDDDGDGAPDAYAEQTHLYNYMSNWATTRSDCFAVYGTVRIMNASNRVEGLRHFVAVIDRVPITAFSPFDEPATAGEIKPHFKYLPARTLMMSWLD